MAKPKATKTFPKISICNTPPKSSPKDYIEMCHFHQPTDADQLIFVQKLGIYGFIYIVL